MRVLHVVTDTDRRGAQVFATDLSNGLAELGSQSEVVALAPGRTDGLLPVEVLGPTRRSRQTFAELRRCTDACDVVVAHGSTTLDMSALAVAGTGTPFVYRQISDPLFWAASWSRRARVAGLIRRAAAVVALSSGASAVLQAHYRLREERIAVIPNAVPGDGFQYAAEPGSADRGHCRLVYVGALAEEKGVDIAIRSLAATPDAELVVVGDGPDRTRLEALAGHAAGGRIDFAGSVEDPKPFLRAASLFVFPSRGGDSMPAALIEAGLSGLPSLTTPVGSIADIVVDGETGRVVPIGDQSAFDTALVDLVTSPPTRRRMGRAARERCLEHFTIDRVAPRWLEVLESVVS